jgi:adenosylcobinamide kinase/adenosylcobinamide-phosphate guanylyltransferase
MTSLFIFGGARSGKSAFATHLGAAHKSVVYWATAPSSLMKQDAEMERRIKQHQNSRPSHFELVQDVTFQEVTKKLSPETLLILDCLTLYLASLIYDLSERYSKDQLAFALEERCKEFCNWIGTLPNSCVVVSNEVGQGVVPHYPSGRFFRDAMGFWNQQMAEQLDLVLECKVGMGTLLKSSLTSIPLPLMQTPNQLFLTYFNQTI